MNTALFKIDLTFPCLPLFRRHDNSCRSSGSERDR